MAQCRWGLRRPMSNQQDPRSAHRGTAVRFALFLQRRTSWNQQDGMNVRSEGSVDPRHSAPLATSLILCPAPRCRQDTQIRPTRSKQPRTRVQGRIRCLWQFDQSTDETCCRQRYLCFGTWGAKTSLQPYPITTTVISSSQRMSVSERNLKEASVPGKYIGK